jgi:hypothetical protein
MFKLERITYIYSSIECISKPSFVKEFKLAKIIYVYWKNECTPKAWFVWDFHLARITYIYLVKAQWLRPILAYAWFIHEYTTFIIPSLTLLHF